MCGRYTLHASPERLAERFGVAVPDSFEPRYNCSPGQELPVITSDDPDHLQRFTWGLTPSWADEKQGLINARSETVRQKRSFADAYESRRCLVPADGFYEWADLGDGKEPYRVAFEDDRPFAMAGLWERWEPPTQQLGLESFGGGDAAADPEPLETFTVITTEPNDLVSELHHRMAVVLAPDEEETWLDGDPDAASELLDPYPDDELEYFCVSQRVNSPANDDSELIEPVTAGSGGSDDPA
ncbi:SOS response-associated peptidase [Halonotius pteroides]|uniref:SOS response-associated peptidase n=1 Tax=Halonotius pteroides TaxID=268735 RepID=A0A3A6Q799_9EURY|nr:SOS response-associated peptidase [Halonotius pteroides]RJX49699.1 SOS response-associated peptidase [Halonotius pteroides]